MLQEYKDIFINPKTVQVSGPDLFFKDKPYSLVKEKILAHYHL